MDGLSGSMNPLKSSLKTVCIFKKNPNYGLYKTLRGVHGPCEDKNHRVSPTYNTFRGASMDKASGLTESQ